MGFRVDRKERDGRRELRWHIQGHREQGKDGRDKSQEEGAETLSSSRLTRASPVSSELSGGSTEQPGFRSETAVASALAPVNEAEDAAELRDSPGGRGHHLPVRATPLPRTGVLGRPRPQRRGNEVE